MKKRVSKTKQTPEKSVDPNEINLKIQALDSLKNNIKEIKVRLNDVVKFTDTSIAMS